MTYKNRYNDTQHQNAYMNAYDLLIYGCDKKFWNTCGLEGEEAEKIWKQAKKDVLEE